MSIDFSGGAPNPGETVTVRFNLPDGTSENLTLTATTNSPPGANEFTIGATPAETATNFQTALTTAIGKLGASALTAASAVAASNDFFNADVNNPPQRVGGSPPFYRRDRHGGRHDRQHGDLVHRRNRQRSGTFDGDGPYRSVVVGFIRRARQRRSNPHAGAERRDAGCRDDFAHRSEWSGAKQCPGPAIGRQPRYARHQTITDIETDLASAQTSLQAAKGRHQQANATLSDFLQQIDGVSNEDVGAQLLTLQTRMQASMQITSMLFQTSLVNYIK